MKYEERARAIVVFMQNHTSWFKRLSGADRAQMIAYMTYAPIWFAPMDKSVRDGDKPCYRKDLLREAVRFSEEVEARVWRQLVKEDISSWHRVQKYVGTARCFFESNYRLHYRSADDFYRIWPTNEKKYPLLVRAHKVWNEEMAFQKQYSDW